MRSRADISAPQVCAPGVPFRGRIIKIKPPDVAGRPRADASGGIQLTIEQFAHNIRLCPALGHSPGAQGLALTLVESNGESLRSDCRNATSARFSSGLHRTGRMSESRNGFGRPPSE